MRRLMSLRIWLLRELPNVRSTILWTCSSIKRLLRSNASSSYQKNSPILLNSCDSRLPLLDLLHTSESLLVIVLNFQQFSLDSNLFPLQFSKSLNIWIINPFYNKLDCHWFAIKNFDVVSLIDEINQFIRNLNFEFLQLLFDDRGLCWGVFSLFVLCWWIYFQLEFIESRIKKKTELFIEHKVQISCFYGCHSGCLLRIDSVSFTIRYF